MGRPSGRASRGSSSSSSRDGSSDAKLRGFELGSTGSAGTISSPVSAMCAPHGFVERRLSRECCRSASSRWPAISAPMPTPGRASSSSDADRLACATDAPARPPSALRRWKNSIIAGCVALPASSTGEPASRARVAWRSDSHCGSGAASRGAHHSEAVWLPPSGPAVASAEAAGKATSRRSGRVPRPARPSTERSMQAPSSARLSSRSKRGSCRPESGGTAKMSLRRGDDGVLRPPACSSIKASRTPAGLVTLSARAAPPPARVTEAVSRSRTGQAKAILE
mmetsp:Transcript_20791/g.60810  ORF Transcript_20791/g.60810 Transcript_20791/m.60810 type:complete len:281 (-) Transcript_20791:8-850(-)